MTRPNRVAQDAAQTEHDRAAPKLQLAALCHRDTEKGREILLITSSHGRWILPKGWPIKGKSGGETALQEAWEEAGVKKGKVSDAPLGRFTSVKAVADGDDVPLETTVYAIKVKDVAKDFPESSWRKRKWVSLQKACGLIDEPGLRNLLQAL